MSPLVSVVVPTCKRDRELRQALDAILVQPVDLEILLVEDGPPGPAGAVAAQLGDSRIRLLRNVGRRGAAATRNVGVEAARGRWMAFCDDDDLWAPDKLPAQLAGLETAGAGWSCTAEITVDSDLQVTAHQRLNREGMRLLANTNVIPGGGSGVVADSTLLREAGGFDESLSNAEDWDLWIRLAQRAQLAIVDRPLLAYRRLPRAKSTNVRGMTTSFDTVLSRYGALPSPELDYARARYLMQQGAHSGKRLRSSAAYLSLAVRHRSPVDGLRAVAVLGWPNAMHQIQHGRARRRIPSGWIDDVERWLAPYRQGGVASG